MMTRLFSYLSMVAFSLLLACGLVYAKEASDSVPSDAARQAGQAEPLKMQTEQVQPQQVVQDVPQEQPSQSQQAQPQEGQDPQSQVMIEERPVAQPPVQSADQPPVQSYDLDKQQMEQALIQQMTSPPVDIARAPKTVPIQATIENVQIEKGPEQKTPPLPTCHVETDVSVWVFGGTKEQGQLLCFNAANQELQYSPVFMTKVFAHSGGFDPALGLYDQIFLYDMTRVSKNGKRAKPKRRLFDYEEMEFQRLNFLPWCKQAIDIAPGKEYVVFVKTPATNYWFDLASRTINTGTTLGSLLAGYFIAK